MPLDNTDTIEAHLIDDAAPAPADAAAVEAAQHDPAPRSHWDKVLAAVQERQ